MSSSLRSCGQNVTCGLPGRKENVSESQIPMWVLKLNRAFANQGIVEFLSRAITKTLQFFEGIKPNFTRHVTSQ